MNGRPGFIVLGTCQQSWKHESPSSCYSSHRVERLSFVFGSQSLLTGWCKEAPRCKGLCVSMANGGFGLRLIPLWTIVTLIPSTILQHTMGIDALATFSFFSFSLTHSNRCRRTAIPCDLFCHLCTFAAVPRFTTAAPNLIIKLLTVAPDSRQQPIGTLY